MIELLRRLPRGLVRKSRTFARTSRDKGLRTAIDEAVFGLRCSLEHWFGWSVGGRKDIGMVWVPQIFLETQDVPPSDLAISVVLPVYNTQPDMLETCIRSVVGQSHEAWQLCICDDHSTSQETRDALARLVPLDPRIRLVISEENVGIAAATNLAAELADGEFLAFLDHDDALHSQALAEIAAAADADPEIDVIYTDEDKLEPDGSHADPFYKPDWSPEYLSSVMYLLHCFAVRASLFRAVGGLRSEFDGAQDYDLALRVCGRARRVHHIRRILYHWRKLDGSASEDPGAKPYAVDAAFNALSEAAQTMAPPGQAASGLTPGTFRIVRPQERPPVTLVILTRDPISDVEGRGHLRILSNFLDSIADRTTYPDYRVLVVDDGELSRESMNSMAVCNGKRISFPRRGSDWESFNFSRKVNFALSHVGTEHFVLLNDDLEVISPDWIEALVDYSVVPGVAAVGGHLRFADGSTQHAGVICKHTGPDHIFYELPKGKIGYYGFTHIVRNYSAVTGAVLASRKSVVEDVGPFDERLAHDFNDIDFCLRACTKGYRNVYTPYCELYHFEHASLQRHQPRWEELAMFNERWREWMVRDPYHWTNEIHFELPSD